MKPKPILVRLCVLGPFRVLDSDGEDRTPRGRKTCALLALLALAKDNKRTRKWIQDKLWSDRADPQGAASLRQSLAEIRRKFGPNKNCLVSDHFTVGLNHNLISIDIDTYNVTTDSATKGHIELLEGMDVRDPEFEDYLRQMRRQFQSRIVEEKNEAAVLQVPAHSSLTNPAPKPYHIVLTRGQEDGSADSALLADSFMDTIAKTITELGFADVIDHRSQQLSAHDVDRQFSSTQSMGLRSNIVKSNGKHLLRVILTKHPENRMLWSNTIEGKGHSVLSIDDENVLNYVNQLINVTLDQLIQQKSESPECLNSVFLCHAGIQTLYQFGGDNFTVADDLFARAFELEPRGIYLAWRAFLRTFLLAERQFSCRQELEDEAFYYMHKSLEMEPHNSFVVAFSAHVHALMRRSHAAAFEMAERCLQLNRANPFGWVGLGLAKCHLGKPEEGFLDTLTASSMAGTAPYRFHLDGLSCIAGVMAGDFDKATICGEVSHANAPSFAPPLRYLSALYLHSGNHEASRKKVLQLKTLEKDFSLESLKDEAYPAAGLQRSNLLNAIPVRQI